MRNLKCGHKSFGGKRFSVNNTVKKNKKRSFQTNQFSDSLNANLHSKVQITQIPFEMSGYMYSKCELALICI